MSVRSSFRPARLLGLERVLEHRPATARTFSLLVQNFTPPSFSEQPISPPPRPPAWTWALTTTPPPLASLSKAAAASSGPYDDVLRDVRARRGEQVLGLILVDLHERFRRKESVGVL